jgi:urease accessory protein
MRTKNRAAALQPTWKFAFLILLAGSALILPAHGHESGAHGLGGGFIDGFMHPLLGADHIAAMVAVGIWGAFLGRPLVWALPIIFPAMMAVGSVYGILGLPLPLTEPGIAASSIVIGLAILAAWRAAVPVACLIVGVFAVFHGYAHGTELPHAADAATYAFGFVSSTGLLHLCGIAFGVFIDRPGGAAVLRFAGAGVALAGLAFVTGLA